MPISFAVLNSACAGTFGESFAYTRLADASTPTISAIRKDPSTLMDVNPSEYIALWVDLNTWVGAAPAKGDTITIDGNVWTLFQIHTDSANGTDLIFAKTQDA